MNRFASKLARLLPVATAAGLALIVPAHVVAQGEQPIIFSSPNDDNTNMPSLTPRAPALPEAAMAVQAQSFDFGATPGPAVPPPSISPAQLAQMQKDLDEKQNWALLTPQELMGIPTPQKIMGLSDDENESVAQRYLERQQTPVTNDVTAQWDLSPNGSISNSAAAAVAVFGSANPAASSFFSQVMGNSTSDQANQNVGNWSFSFGSGPGVTASQPTPEQVAATEEALQKMITPFNAPLSSSSQTEPSFNANAFNVPPKPVSPAAQPVQDTLLAQPQFNPMGESFQPLRGGVQAPVTAKPLPGLIQQNKTPAASEWKPQLPPWLSPVPQPGQIR
ncbi:MAG TPA: hypothetical protein VGN23_03050 [Verrucomicrobiae bacterium]